MNPSHDFNKSTLIWILRLASFLVFFGRGWQHLFWDAPYRSLLWDEALLSGAIEALTPWTWQQYATSATVDQAIQSLVRATGVLYVLCAAASLRVSRRVPREFGFDRTILKIGAASLVFLSFLYCKDAFFQVGQFLEYASQFGAPLLLLAVTRLDEGWVTSVRLERAIAVCVALTFVCHGLYAVGFYPQPGEFVDMTIRILGVHEEQARFLLRLMGVIDFVLAAAILSGVQAPLAYTYACFWGMATSLARVVANVSGDTFVTDSLQWLPDTIYRFPHALVPLAGLIIVLPPGQMAWSKSQIRKLT